MIEVVKGDIWDYYDKGWYVVCTTNGVVNNYGQAIMGAGIALQVKNRFPRFEYALGKKLKKNGNKVYYFNNERIFTFPTKEHWKNDSIPSLINRSCEELKFSWPLWESMWGKEIKIIMTKPGCGNGNLKWEDVYPIVDKHFGDFSKDKFLIIDNGSGVL